MLTADFDFELPPELIAQHPPNVRGRSRLLHVAAHQQTDAMFSELADYLSPQDLLIFNDTRVIKARFWGVKPSGGRVEVFIERVVDDTSALAHIRASHAPSAGMVLQLADGQLTVTVLAKEGSLYRIRFPDTLSSWDALAQFGALPLPPYISRPATDADEARYQTVYAREQGAVAAPTAGLHFDDAMLARLQARGIALAWVTLHVGAGTFQPVRVEKIADHFMHHERYHLPEATVAAIAACRARGGKVVAVGTTSLRALEAAAQQGSLHAHSAETNIFITPGYQFQVVDRLLTNFHLPRSTLLMLVSAFGGVDALRVAYQHAVAARYQFFSYGDAMLIERADCC